MTDRRDDDEPYRLVGHGSPAMPRERRARKAARPPAERAIHERLLQPTATDDAGHFRLTSLPAERWGYRKILHELNLDWREYARLKARGMIPPPIVQSDGRLYWAADTIRSFREQLHRPGPGDGTGSAGGRRP
jgi:hypothetical protein